MKQKKGFVLRQVCGEQVIVGEGIEQIDFNKIITLNDTAAFLWKEAGKGEFTVASLAEALVKEYDVEPERALRDVENVVAKWLEEGMFEQ